MKRSFAPEKRLEILRSADGERKWISLDDKRVCVVCDQVMAGHEIEITDDQRGHYSLNCPTEGCPSSINHWHYCDSPGAPARVEVVGRKKIEIDFLFL